MRTIVNIPEQQLAGLAKVSKQERISRAEAVRRAVAQYLHARQAADCADDAFGLWQGRHGDGLEYEDHLRREWERP